MADEAKIAIYKRIYNELLDEIISGKYLSDQKLPSEKELCARYHVERNTVRKALKLLTEQNYITRIPGVGTMLSGASAGSSAGASSAANKGTILMLIQRHKGKSNISENFHMTLYNILEEKFSKLGYLFVMKIIGKNDNFESAVNAISPKAILFDSYFQNHFYEKAAACGILCISINNYTPYLTSITNNNSDGANQVIRLLRDNGHERIAIITGPNNYQTTLDRLHGVKSYFLKNNVSDAGIRFVTGDWSYESGHSLTTQIWETSPVEARPTAFFAFNDDMAYGCLAALAEHDVSVPEKVSVVGFDRSYQHGFVPRQITTVDCNIDVIAEYVLWYIQSSLEHHIKIASASIEIRTDIVDNGTVTQAEQPALL